MARHVRCAIIGCGVIGPTHAESVRALADTSITWACDLVPEKAERLASKYAVGRTSADYRDVLSSDDVDCVHVCTDHGSHAEIVEAALDAGKHVICEKALASNTAGLDRMMAAHRRNPGIAFGGIFQHRFDTVSGRLKELIQEGVQGTLLMAGARVLCRRTDEYYRADKWRGTWEHEGGSVLINQAIHFIDLLAWLAGGVEAVCGAHGNLAHAGVIETEDVSTASVRFRCGAFGTIQATSASRTNWESSLSFVGTEGMIEITHSGLSRAQFGDKAVEERVTRVLSTAEETGPVESAKWYYGSSHTRQIADFIEAVREGRPPMVTGLSARHAVDIVLGIYQSDREKAWVELPRNES